MNTANTYALANIYAIVRTETGDAYVGCTRGRVSVRWNGHRTALKLNRHHSRLLQAAWNEHGADAFRVIELASVDGRSGGEDERRRVELAWIAKIGTYNSLVPDAAGERFTFNAEMRKRASAAMKDRWADPEEKKKLQQGLITRWRDPEDKARMIARAVARAADPEHIARVSAKVKKAWAEGDREAWVAAQVAGQARPEVKKRHREALKASWDRLEGEARTKRAHGDQTPEQVREKAVKANAARWAKPGAKERWLAAMRKWREGQSQS